MQVKLKKIFTSMEIPKNTKFIFDKTSKIRPAWIKVNNLPKNTGFISLGINENKYHYRVYLPSVGPLFIPIDYTKEEINKYYKKFAKDYEKKINPMNSKAIEYLFSKIHLSNNIKILDLGAGTGISTIPLIKKGYNNITLLDISNEMLSIAKKKKELKRCKFIQKDISTMKINNKFDLIFSAFSFASNNYFSQKEMIQLWEKIAKNLKPNGILMLIGNNSEPNPKLFRKINSGTYDIIPNSFKAKWYIGEKIK